MRIENQTSKAHREAFALRYLAEHPEGAGPTTIGVAFGMDRDRASSLFSRLLIDMAQAGLLERLGPPHEVRYKLVKK